ncbi:MAG: hypothetical protein LBQ64_06365 [Bacteroidales bacterium]|jgi:hypothetical protein|nr:hypothetical protein [Bacteroidales bacterium]
MAKQKGNVVTYGLSGKIGDLLVFRQRDGKTIVSKIPKAPKTESENQKKHRKRFQQAVIYAKAATSTPEGKALYGAAKKCRTPFNTAVSDFFNTPKIENIDLYAYTGTVGDKIRIMATDDFAVKSVHVQINNADGSLVEEGEAVPDVTGQLWTYTTTQNNDNLNGDKIVVSACDHPGNITKEEQIL